MITLAGFRSSEVEEITGVNAALQRDWRRRGILPTNEGHARFELFDVAELLVMKLLADRGVGPLQTLELARWAAIGVAWHALKWVDAYEGDHLHTFEWEPEAIRPKGKRDKAIVKLAEKAGVKLPPEPAIAWAAQSAWLTRRVLSRRKARVVPARFLVWWANDEHVFHDSLDEAFAGFSRDPEYAGPVIVLDLDATASNLIDRAPRPLVRVAFERDGAGRILEPEPELEFGGAVPLSGSRNAEHRR